MRTPCQTHTAVHQLTDTNMAQPITHQQRQQRRAAVRADRARGWSFRKIAAHHGLSVGMAHYLAADVQMVLLPPWHRARLLRDAPLPPLWQIHRLFAPPERTTRQMLHI
jgi:hypothetical protein